MFIWSGSTAGFVVRVALLRHSVNFTFQPLSFHFPGNILRPEPSSEKLREHTGEKTTRPCPRKGTTSSHLSSTNLILRLVVRSSLHVREGLLITDIRHDTLVLTALQDVHEQVPTEGSPQTSITAACIWPESSWPALPSPSSQLTGARLAHPMYWFIELHTAQKQGDKCIRS